MDETSTTLAALVHQRWIVEQEVERMHRELVLGREHLRQLNERIAKERAVLNADDEPAA